MIRSVLKPAFSNPAVVEALRPLISGGPIRAALIPHAIDPAAAAALRRQLGPRLEPFDLAHRGRYAHTPWLDEPLLQFAAALFQVRTAEARGSLLRLRRGDYSLIYDDARTRLATGLEVLADLSPAPLEGAETIYSCGPGQERSVPQQPGLVAVIARPPEVHRYEPLLGHRTGRAQVFRLRLQLAFA